MLSEAAGARATEACAAAKVYWEAAEAAAARAADARAAAARSTAARSTAADLQQAWWTSQELADAAALAADEAEAKAKGIK